MFTLWPSAFVDDVSRITAQFLNDYVRVPISRALDGVGGGSYALLNDLIITGAGFVLDKVQMSGTNRVTLVSRSITRQQAMLGFTRSANWSLSINDYLIWRNTAQGGELDLALDRLPHGQTLDSVVLRWAPAGGHAGLPDPMPGFTVYRVDQGGSATSLGVATDPSASVGAYQAVHDIPLSSIAHTVNLENYRYMIRLTGEGATNFVANAEAIQLKVGCTCTFYPEY
jgi:hypothetical protein